MIKKTNFASILLLLFLCSLSGGVRSQDSQLSDQLDNQGFKGQEESILVSRDLYNEILTWLSMEESEEQTLDHYLLTSTFAEKSEVKRFVSQYYSGLTKRQPSINAKTTNENDNEPYTGCECKSVIPRDDSPILKSEVSDFLGTNVQNVGSGEVVKTTGYHSKGIAFDFHHEVFFDDLTNREETYHQDNHEVFEILYLCTIQGRRSSKCNCDKLAVLKGEFQFDFSHRSAVTQNNSEINSQLRVGFFGFEADRDVVNFNPNNLIHPNFKFEPISAKVYQVGRKRRDDYLSPPVITDIDWEIDADFSPFARIHDHLTSFNPNINYLANVTRGNFLKDLGRESPHDQPYYDLFHTSYDHEIYTQSDLTQAIEHTLVLRANVPKVFVFASSIHSRMQFDGNEANARHLANGNFWTTLIVPGQTDSYQESKNNQYGELGLGNPTPTHPDPEFSYCCNGDFARFSFDAVNNTPRYDELKDVVVDAMNIGPSWSPVLEYSEGIGVAVIDGDVLYVDGSNQSGYAYDFLACGNCDYFRLPYNDENGLPLLWDPIVEVTGDPCGEFLQVEVLNFGEMQTTPGSVAVTVQSDEAFGGVRWEDAILPGPNSSPNAYPFQTFDIPINTTSQPITYKLEFTHSEGCSVVAIFTVLPCGSSQSRLDCFDMNLVPIPGNAFSETGLQTGLDLELDWINWEQCPNFPSNDGSNDSKFIIEVFNMQGVRVYNAGPFDGINPVSSHVISNSNFTNTPAYYILKITFADFTTITRRFKVN